jgi:hypothetical protein
MSTDREFLDERYAYSESAPNGEQIICNCVEKVAPGAVLEDKDITFIGEIGYGVTVYNIPAGLVACTDKHEIANRIAASLPVTTPHNTKVCLLQHKTYAQEPESPYVLLVWGNGSADPSRMTRISEIRAARLSSVKKAEDTKSKTKLMTCSQINNIQTPLIHHSESYRKRVASTVIAALCGEFDSNLIEPPTDTCVRQMFHRVNDPNLYLLHDYYPRGTESMWLMHGPAGGATLYTLEQETSACECPNACNQGIPVSDFKKNKCEEAPKSLMRFDHNATAVAGQPYKSFKASVRLPVILACDAGVTRFVPVNALESNYVTARELDIAQGLAGYIKNEFSTVCTIIGSSLASNGMLYGNIPINPVSCMQHTNNQHESHIVIPNTSQWMQILFDISPDKSALYFLNDNSQTQTVRNSAGTVSGYRIPRQLFESLDLIE